MALSANVVLQTSVAQAGDDDFLVTLGNIRSQCITHVLVVPGVHGGALQQGRLGEHVQRALVV